MTQWIQLRKVLSGGRFEFKAGQQSLARWRVKSAHFRRKYHSSDILELQWGGMSRVLKFCM